MTNGGRVLAAVLVLATVGACRTSAPTLVTIVNRTDATLTVGPGIVIGPCDSSDTTIAGFEKAREAAIDLALAGEMWDAPDGALVWTGLALGSSRDNVLPGAMTLIVSSTADPEARVSSVPEADLPPCGGQPRGIEPGVPQDEDPAFGLGTPPP